MDLLVDPIIYAVPDISKNPDAHIQFVASLALWSEEFRNKRHNFYVWQDCMDALFDAGCFPDPQNLKKLWALANEEVVSPDIAFAACCRLFEIPFLEHWIEDPDLYDVLIDEEDFQLRPDLLERLPHTVAATFQRALGRIAYVKVTRDNSPASDLLLITHPVAVDPVAEIAAYVVADGHNARIETDFPLITTPDDLDSLLDVAGQWQEPEKAIKWLAKDMIRNGELPKGTTLASFTVGPNFVSSIAEHQFDKKPGWLQQIYRRCVLVLTGYATTDPEKHHPLDKHKQRKRGNWGAWRIHVTGSPMAIRLHYWRHGNTYLLMNIVPHENLQIDEPPK